jgi:hypothetical protein
MSLLKLKTGAPVPVTPREFFGSICPKVLALQAEICRKLGGTYAFSLFGDGGGAWTLDYTDAAVRDGAAEDADLWVEMDASDFTELLKGTLDLDAAASAGRIRLRGNPALLSRLVAVLEPAQGNP